MQPAEMEWARRRGVSLAVSAASEARRHHTRGYAPPTAAAADRVENTGDAPWRKPAASGTPARWWRWRRVVDAAAVVLPRDACSCVTLRAAAG